MRGARHARERYPGLDQREQSSADGLERSPGDAPSEKGAVEKGVCGGSLQL